MQSVSSVESISTQTLAPAGASTAGGQAAAHPLAHYQIIRRNGAVVPFEPNKIAVAMMKAFLAVHGTQGAASASVRETVEQLTQNVVRALLRSRPSGGTFHIEDVQDQVELGLMRGGHHEVARAYVLYRERRAQERAKQGVPAQPKAAELHVVDGDRCDESGELGGRDACVRGTLLDRHQLDRTGDDGAELTVDLTLPLQPRGIHDEDVHVSVADCALAGRHRVEVTDPDIDVGRVTA
jgi:hypothetical protein